MPLLYKDDWDETKDRYRAWWNGEYIGRCGLFVTAPREGIPNTPPPTPPEDPEERWTDLDYMCKAQDYEFRRTYYGAEAFPNYYPGYPGHTAIPAFLGCKTTLDHETGWWEPFLSGPEWRIKDIVLNKESRWWKFAIEQLDRMTNDALGKAIPSTGAFGGSGDTLAAIRGTDRLLIDVMERSDLVRQTEEYLMDMWFEVYDTFYDIVKESTDGGSQGWFPLWAPGKFYGAQNDFSYMISPAMFRDLFLAVIRRQTEFLDYTIYHVDGIGAFAHVPALCELPKLQAIQILPGDGKPSPLHYPQVLKIVQQAGKNLWIMIEPNEVEQALALLSAKGLFIHTTCKTESQARQLIENVKKWSRRRI
ncbi:MAG: hypothetical protein WC975_03620 [Phycisphaerae bacterium]